MFVDYLTISLGNHTIKALDTTPAVLNEFAAILPKLYKRTCRDMVICSGKTMRVSQFGISVARQYGTAEYRGWLYSVQLSGDYWCAIGHDRDSVLKILSGFSMWRVSRLDLACDVCVPLDEWRDYCTAAFVVGEAVTGKGDARTIYYGSRLSQFYTRVYNKSEEDPKYFTAPDGYAYIRFEVEIHRVRGELVLEHTFDQDFTERLFLQRVCHIADIDRTRLITNHFVSARPISKIKTVERIVGNLEKTVDYVCKAYAPYIGAVLHSEMIADKYDGIENLNDKSKKILAIIDSEVTSNCNKS